MTPHPGRYVKTKGSVFATLGWRWFTNVQLINGAFLLLASVTLAQEPIQVVDFESDRFDEVRLSGKHQTVVPNPRGDGLVFRAYVPRTEERSEIALNRHLPGEFQWKGETRYYAWDTFLPKGFSPSGRHTILAQWHRWQPGMNDRFAWAKGHPNAFAIDQESGRYMVSLSYQKDPATTDGSGRTHIHEVSPEAIRYQDDLGKWVNWSARVRWSTDRDGLFVLYRNGEPVVRHEGPNYLNLPEGPYFKCGLYTGDPWDGPPADVTAYFDNVIVEKPSGNIEQRPMGRLRIVSDIPYSDTENPRQQLDLVIPSTPSVEDPLPTIVLIHGGGWRQGNRAGYLSRAKEIAATGRYAAATVGYRLSGEATWPAQIHDCKAAVRWLKAHADQYNLDTERFAASGGSAGGHLAAMLGVSADVEELNGTLGNHADQSSRVDCVFERYGPTDLLSMNDAPGKLDHDAPNSPESRLIGGPIQENQSLARSASPTHYVTQDDAPFLILHGTEDMLVPHDQSVRLRDALIAAGVECQLVSIPDAGHGLKGVDGLMEQEIAFLDRHFWPNRSASSKANRVKRPSSRPTNVVLVLIDDLGWNDLSCYGSSYYETPNIDLLASRGMRFTDAYAACNVCTPSRAAIMTGKSPARLMMTQWLPGGRWDRTKHRMREGRYLSDLPLTETTIAEALRDQGYQTGFIGKWHLGSETYSSPLHHGFDINVAGRDYGAPGSYFYPFEGKWRIPTTNLFREKTMPIDGKPGDYLVDRLADEAVKFIDDSKGGPFFLMLSHYAVHAPLQAKPSMVDRFSRIPQEQRQGDPKYAAMVASVDESVGRVLRALERNNVANETLVVFTSDNGGWWKGTDNAPLRGNKGNNYEAGIRVPLIVRWPTQTDAGSVSRVPVVGMDLYPTMLEAAVGLTNPFQHVDGESLVPLLQSSGGLKRDALYWHYPHYNRHPNSFPSGVIREGDWKLIESYETAEISLFDLAQDIGESANVASLNPSVAKRLLTKLRRWRKTVGADPMLSNPEYAVAGAASKPASEQ
ncbi:MAG: sulfatase-like hydrolase/transferase [Planctomycetota bacterium]